LWLAAMFGSNARNDEVIGALAPFPHQRQLHPVQILRLVREDHRGIPWGDGNLAVARCNQVGEVEEAILLLILRPGMLKLPERGGPGRARQHQSTEPAQLLE
jgi:hypothetical protein